MIYLNEEFMDVEELFRKSAYTKRGDAYYFTAEEVGEDTFLCVKLFNQNSDKRFEIEVVEAFVDFEKREAIVDEVEVGLKEDIEFALNKFFHNMSYTDSIQDVMMFEGIFDMVSEYIEGAFFYGEEKKIVAEFMELFEVSGVLSEGNYSGTIKLVDVAFKNRMTNQTIIDFDEIYLEGMLDAEDDDEFESLLEAYSESMSEFDILEILNKVLN